MPRHIPLPPELGSAFSVAEARAAGVSADRLRNSRVDAHFRGSRSVASSVANRQDASALLARCAAYAAIAPLGFRFSHVTAARLYGIPLPRRLERREQVDVSVSTGGTPRRRGVIGHRSQDAAARTVRGFPCVPPEVVWLQLSTALDLDELVTAGDHLVRRKRPQSSLERLESVVRAGSGVRGVVRARAALRGIRPGTDSPQESRMRLALVRAGLREPVIGHTVYDGEGNFVGTPDLAYVPERIAIEYEGEDHRTDPHTFRSDIERRELFELAGWRVVRVTMEHLRQPGRLAARIARILDERAS